MLKKRVFPFYRALPLGLLLCLFVGTAPAFGQETFAESLVSEDLQAVASYGYCFGSELSNEKCRTVMLNVQWFDFLTTLRRWFSGSSDNTSQLDYLGYPQRSMNRTSSLGRMRRMAGNGLTDLALQGTAQSQSRDTWPPPGGGGTRQSIAKADGVSKVAGDAPKVRHTTISTTFDNSYDRSSDLATIAAVYTTFDIFGDPSSFTIDAAGVITGQSNSGCVLNGQVSIIDAMFNAYDVSLEVANCGALDGMYDGLGTSQDDVAMDDTFVFAVFTAQMAIVGVAEK